MDKQDAAYPAPKYAENSALIAVGVVALAGLYYQVPRLTAGLDPSFVHPSWVEESAFPLIYKTAAVPYWVWGIVLALVFVRIFRNYDWTISRRSVAPSVSEDVP